MPTYDLQAGTTGNPVDCGNVLVSMAGNQVTIQYQAPGQGPVNIPGAAYNNAGGGTAVNPKPGDTLNLNGYQVTISGTAYRFNGTAVFQNANGNQNKGYYHNASTSPGGAVGDWDAADSGGK